MSFELLSRIRTLEAERKALEDVTIELLLLLAHSNPVAINMFRTAIRPIAEKHLPASGVDDPYAFALTSLLAKIEDRITPID